jgi:hypothetical protein
MKVPPRLNAMVAERRASYSCNRAKKLLQVDNPLQKWGLAIAMRRGRNKAAVSVARKLCVTVWHVMQGHVIGTIERMDTLHTKLHKLATELGVPTIKKLGHES